jgi:hypothetical protein
MSDRAKAAAARLHEHVPILEVLQAYGYRIREDGGLREQQFSCDLHGSGRDLKPSARVYPESNTWYCFSCDKTRDAIETVRAKDGLKFWDAVKLLEKNYGLDPLPLDYGLEDQTGPIQALASTLDATQTFAQDLDQLQRLLDRCTINRDLPLESLLRFWEKFDEVSHRVQGSPNHGGGQWTETQGRVMLHGLRQKIMEARR